MVKLLIVHFIFWFFNQRDIILFDSKVSKGILEDCSFYKKKNPFMGYLIWRITHQKKSRTIYLH